MELLSYNGGYIGYVPDQSLNLVTTGQTVENENTGNIHIVGKAFSVDWSSNSIQFSTSTSYVDYDGARQPYEYFYHNKGDVIVLYSYADTFTTTQGQDFFPDIRDGTRSYSWTLLNNNTNSADTNTWFGYFVCPNSGIFLTNQGSGTSGATSVNFSLMAIRGLCKADGTLAGVSTTSAVFGSSGLPVGGNNSVSIPSGGSATDNWIVIQGWAVDDDVNSSSNLAVGVRNYEFGHCRSLGTSSSGGTTGLAATIYRGAGGVSVSSGAVGFKTSASADATDAWVVNMAAFKAGVEPTRTIKVPSVTGVYSLAAYTRKVGKWTQPLYPDGFPADDAFYYYKPYQQLSGEFCQSMYVTGSGSNSFSASYFAGGGSTFNPTYYTYGKTYQQISQLFSLQYSGNGTTASVTTTRCSRIWIAEPCKIRFISLYYARSSDTISWDVYEHSRLGGSLVAAYGPVSGNASAQFYSPYSSYYTISKPCYIVISLTSTLGGGGGSIPNNYAVIHMEHIRV